MAKPRLLDLFCGAGGAAVGYERAGFDVEGVDINPQPNYPFSFVQSDALEYLRYHFRDGFKAFAAIHASPPCQFYCGLTAQSGSKDKHPDLIEPVRKLLAATGLPFILENVIGAPLMRHVVLCGSMFGLPLRRHRIFESNIILFRERCRHNEFPKNIEILNHGKKMTWCVPVYGAPGGKAPDRWNEAMGIDWMTQAEITQAIPPAYTEFLGAQLLRAVEQAA